VHMDRHVWHSGMSPVLAGLGLAKSDWASMQTVGGVLLAVVSLSMSVVLFRSNLRRRPPGDAAAGVRMRLLGVVLVVCGIAQFVGINVTMPPDRLAVVSMVTAALCWSAALTLVPLFARARPGNEDDGHEQHVEQRRWAEEALRNVESEARKLVEADARKNEFLAMLGHELRNPLAPIRNAVKIMKQRGSDDPDLCWARDVIDHQVHHLGQLVDDLLEISRVTSGKVRLHKEPVDVATIIAFAVETSRPVLDAQNHHLSIVLPRRPVLVAADSIRMAQVLSNLLNNASKYTSPRGHIRLAAIDEGAEVVFRVRDNGIGIPPEMLSTIFDLFAQVDHSLDHSQGGLGLGLTLVKSLVELHGGSVRAESDGIARGSEFIVKLPVLGKVFPKDEPTLETSSRAPLPTTKMAGASRRVLVVDDNVASAESLAKVLKLEGHDVQVAHDGGVVFDAVRSVRPEVVLMDIGLPTIDGYELAQRLRNDPDLGAGVALVVAVTGYAEDEARRRSREAGFDHHLVKPVDPDGVISLLASLEWEDEPRRAPTRKPSSLVGLS
jgi:signal transduction histidine kinase/CheY-like chemotaxis protein